MRFAKILVFAASLFLALQSDLRADDEDIVSICRRYFAVFVKQVGPRNLLA